MDKADLEQYQLQLSQVETALEADPSNTELSELRNELKQLIDLTEQALAQASSSKAAETSRKSASATPSHSWSAGDECLAKYSGDGQWYPARITSVGGSESNRVYSIVFKGYNTTELVNSSQIKQIPANYQAPATISNKRKLTKVEEEERERKKKKNEKEKSLNALLEEKRALEKELNEKEGILEDMNPEKVLKKPN